MRIEGSYTFSAPQDVVWQSLLDPDILARTMPGCEKLEKVGDNEFLGVLKIRIGPMQGDFSGGVTLSELNPPDGYRMRVSGRGPSGFLDGTGRIRLEGQDSATVMHYEGDAQVGGRIATVGNRLLDRSARALVNQSLDQLNQQILARLAAAAAGPAAPPLDLRAPTQSEFALGMARNFLDDLAPAERRPQLAAGALGALALLVLLRAVTNWFANRVARRTADILWTKEVRARDQDKS